MERNNNDILLLDGKCGLCNRLALFIAAHMSSHKKIKFLPIDSNDAQELIKTFPSYQQKLDTVYLYKMVTLIQCLQQQLDVCCI